VIVVGLSTDLYAATDLWLGSKPLKIFIPVDAERSILESIGKPLINAHPKTDTAPAIAITAKNARLD
jgi:hypothetical protein